MLISVSELLPLVPYGTTLLDVRWRLTGPPGREAYDEGHIPGAVFCDLDRDLSDEPGAGGRHPLPPPERFQAAMRRLGVGAGPVVVYDDADATAAARAWWTLRYFGHTDVRVLDGGFRAWVAEGGPVTGETAAIGPGTFTARPGGMPVADAGEAARIAAEGALLDARAEERYRGESEPVDPVAGHIPGAISAPASGNVDESGRVLTPAALAERFARLGVSPGRPAGAYCGSGVTAAQEVLALRLAGIDAALYAGSWSHWITDPARPVAGP